MATPLRLPLPEDEYIADYNNQLEEQPLMKQYRESQKNGSIAAALGPSLRLLKSVPQSIYTGNNRLPDKTLDLSPPIQFFLEESVESDNLKPKGLVLAEAIEEKPIGLRGGTERVYLGHSTKVSIRLRVDGYEDCGAQMGSCRATMEKEGKELAEIAQKVAAFIYRSMPSEGTEVPQWHLSNGDKVQFDDLILLELRHVSTGSWQPVLAYFR